MIVLGIDTSCDDTSAAVVVDGVRILSNIISSQVDIHGKFGGIVPEIASRHHVEAILYVIQSALDEAGVRLEDIDLISVTNRPGLIGSLLVGVAVAKSIAYCNETPIIGVNHIDGHVYSGFLANPEIPIPHVCLTISGGHTILARVISLTKYEVIGTTQDDAAGESFDKVSQYLGLGFPGGPIIDRLAKTGDPNAIPFPRPMMQKGNLNFSFSGLKTAVRNFMMKSKESNSVPPLEDIAASFQEAVVDVLVSKTMGAALTYEIGTISVTGGVAANSRLRDKMASEAMKHGISVYFPPLKLCTDNAAMIAGIGYQRYLIGESAGLDLNGEPTAPPGN